MTLTLELTPMQEARLRQIARSAKVSPEQLAQSAVERFLISPVTRLPESDAAMPLSLRSYRGAGAGAPVGKDAQEYVNDLRSEWDERP